MGVTAACCCVDCDWLAQQLPQLLGDFHPDLSGLEIVLCGCILQNVSHWSIMVL